MEHIIKISINDYAEFKGITPQAVSKRIRSNAERGLPLDLGFDDILQIDKVYRSYQIHFIGRLKKDGTIIHEKIDKCDIRFASYQGK